MNEEEKTANTGKPLYDYRDWRDLRREERMARRAAKWQRRAARPYGWTGGAFLILLGTIFLLQEMGIPLVANWWALFILIPAFWSFVAAWEAFEYSGQLTRSVAGALTGGLLLTLVALFLLTNLYLALFWPVLLILGGLLLLATAFLPE